MINLLTLYLTLHKYELNLNFKYFFVIYPGPHQLNNAAMMDQLEKFIIFSYDIGKLIPNKRLKREGSQNTSQYWFKYLNKQIHCFII